MKKKKERELLRGFIKQVFKKIASSFPQKFSQSQSSSYCLKKEVEEEEKKKQNNSYSFNYVGASDLLFKKIIIKILLKFVNILRIKKKKRKSLLA